MSPVHLSDFVKETLSYGDPSLRFTLIPEPGAAMRAYEIAMDAPGPSYFKALYGGAIHGGAIHGDAIRGGEAEQGHPSAATGMFADGMVVGNFHAGGRLIFFVLVIALEGSTPGDDPVERVKHTLDHFYRLSQDSRLEDDGMRHHVQALREPAPYIAHPRHNIAGVVIDSRPRQDLLARFLRWPILCLDPHRTVHEMTPQALFAEIAANTGQPYW
jgi:hypothetical protein